MFSIWKRQLSSRVDGPETEETISDHQSRNLQYDYDVAFSREKSTPDSLNNLRVFVEDFCRHAELFRTKVLTYIDWLKRTNVRTFVHS